MNSADDPVHSPAKRVRIFPLPGTAYNPAAESAATSDSSSSSASSISSDSSDAEEEEEEEEDDDDDGTESQPLPDLRARLAAFLPQLKAANEQLDAQRRAGTLPMLELDDDAAAAAESHIELDLGLGVLEERRPGNDEDSEDEDDQGSGQDGERDVLGKLMGAQRTGAKKGIEEVGGAGRET